MSYCRVSQGHPFHEPYHDREYGFPIRGFRSNGAEVVGDPSYGLRGGYAALSIGLGGQ